VALQTFPWTDGGCFKGRRRVHKEVTLELGTAAEQAAWTERIERHLFPVGASYCFNRPGPARAQKPYCRRLPPPLHPGGCSPEYWSTRRTTDTAMSEPPPRIVPIRASRSGKVCLTCTSLRRGGRGRAEYLCCCVRVCMDTGSKRIRKLLVLINPAGTPRSLVSRHCFPRSTLCRNQREKPAAVHPAADSMEKRP
jgi:hypothetical protein